MRDVCIICGSFIMGQRWRYCSDKCNNVHNARKSRAKIRFKELKQSMIDARYKRIELNSSPEALQLIKDINNSI